MTKNACLSIKTKMYKILNKIIKMGSSHTGKQNFNYPHYTNTRYKVRIDR